MSSIVLGVTKNTDHSHYHFSTNVSEASRSKLFHRGAKTAKRLKFPFVPGKDEVGHRVPDRGSKTQDKTGHKARDGEVGPEVFHLISIGVFK